MKYVYRNPIMWSGIVTGVVMMIIGKVLDALTPAPSAWHLLSDFPFEGGAIMTGLFGLFVIANFLGSRFTAPWEATEWVPTALIFAAAGIAVLTLVAVMIFNTDGLEVIATILYVGVGLMLLAGASAFFIAGLRPPPIRFDD